MVGAALVVAFVLVACGDRNKKKNKHLQHCGPSTDTAATRGVRNANVPVQRAGFVPPRAACMTYHYYVLLASS